MTIKDAIGPPVEDQLAHLRKRNDQLEHVIENLRISIGAHKEIAEAIRDSVKAVEPLKNNYKIPTPKKHMPEVVSVLCMGDTHVGEVTEPSEIEGFGKYNYRIAVKRERSIVDSFLKYVKVQRRIYTIKKCVILGLADYVSGNIHYELSVTNEFPAPVAAVKAGLMIGESVSTISTQFEEVELDSISLDNHGRFTPKAQSKQGAFNNWSYVVNEFAKAHLLAHKNVTVNIANGVKELWRIGGKAFLTEHGHTLKGWMGIPFYDIERKSGREAMKRMKSGLEFDYQVYGHFHTPNFLFNRVIMNGSLSGTNEYDHGQGRHSGPAQVGFLVSKKHGVFNFTAWSGE